jgi:hypothetical protein
MPTPITPSTYAIELRNKDFELIERLEDGANNIRFEWNAFGGCGRCTLRLDGDYLRYKPRAEDEIRIYLPDETSGATLWYRGFIDAGASQLDSGSQSISLEFSGYSDWFDRLQVHDEGEELVFEGVSLDEIVDYIVDNFIVANSPITKGTIDVSNFTPDVISFKGSVANCLNTIADLSDAVEYGVDEDLVFFWRNRSTTVREKFFIGDGVVKINDRKDFRNIVNKIYFEGGNVDGVTFRTIGQAESSQSRFGLRERIISNGSITTLSVANQFMRQYFKRSGSPGFQFGLSVQNYHQRLEATQPMGLIQVIDEDAFQDHQTWGTAGAGGSGLVWGTLLNGGSGKVWGTTRNYQFDRIQYSLSPEKGRINAQFQFGDSLSFSKASAALKRLELQQEALRQRSL